MNAQITTQEMKRASQAVMQTDRAMESPSAVQSSGVMRRFYQVRESGKTSEYDLASGLKQYVLEQKSTAQFLSASNRDTLEGLVGMSPDTGSLQVLEQEHHDVKQSSALLRRYQRDHFVMLEGTGEELVMAEQFLSGKGRFIDAKICAPKSRLKNYLGNLKPAHSENAPRVCSQIAYALNPLNILGKILRKPLALIGLLAVGAVVSYNSSNITLRSQKQAISAEDTRGIISQTYTFSTKNYYPEVAESSKQNLANYLKASYPKDVNYSISSSKFWTDYGYRSTVEGVITGSKEHVEQIRTIVKGSLNISKDSLTPIYRPKSAEKVSLEEISKASGEARK